MHLYAYEAAGNCDTLEQFLELLTHHIGWLDVSGKPVPPARTDWLIQYWQAYHRTPREIVELSGKTMKDFAKEYYIPLRTVEDWCAGRRNCATYTRLLLQESLGIFQKRPPREAYTGVIAPGADGKEW